MRLRDVGGDDALDRLAGDLRAARPSTCDADATSCGAGRASDATASTMAGVVRPLRRHQRFGRSGGARGVRLGRAAALLRLSRRRRAPTWRALLGALLARCARLARTLAPTRKVLCLDCDNTLWGGAVGGLGAAGVTLSAPYVAAQRFFVELQRRGLLVCLVSRNEEADVRAVFEARAAEMPLRLDEHVVAVAANWRPKSENLRELARDLCLDVGSFVFVDDSPLECAAGCTPRSAARASRWCGCRAKRLLSAARLPARVLGV